MLVRFIDIDYLAVMNRESSLSRFIEENEDSLQRLASIDADKLYLVINRLDLKFDNVILEKVPSEVVSALIDENRYGINLTMLKRVVKFLNPKLAAGVESRPYSSLNELACDSILQNIRSHIPEFVNRIIAQGSMNDLDIRQEIFDAAWNVLDTHKQEELMFMYLSILDDKSLSSCFSDLGGDYADFIDRSSRHKVELKCSDNNWRLAQRLKELDYITSYSEGKSARKGKNADQDCKVIQCWIKAGE